MTFKLGFSPCPNDTFMFYALVNQRFPSHFNYDYVIDDIAKLNEHAINNTLDITKLSYHTLGLCLNNYQSLLSGAALGKGCGPLLIARPGTQIDDLINGPIAIPGKHTTANLLFNMAFNNTYNTYEVLFSTIEDEVTHSCAVAGLIIHETRFTFKEKGLIQLFDFGNYWEDLTDMPLPLGGIAVRRHLDMETKKLIDDDIRKSIAYAFNNRGECMEYCASYAQEMDPLIMNKHIDLYVNEHSLHLKLPAQKAILRLLEEMVKQNPGINLLPKVFIE